MAARIELKRKEKETPNRDAVHTLTVGLVALSVLVVILWAFGLF